LESEIALFRWSSGVDYLSVVKFTYVYALFFRSPKGVLKKIEYYIKVLLAIRSTEEL
jgi:hypothetical protein